MSIADRITSMSNNLSNAYGRIEYLGVDTSSIDKNLQNLSTVLDTVYNEYPKVSDEGVSPSITGSRVGRLSSTLKGNTSQDGTPTPDNPVDINVVKGDNTIEVCGKNLINLLEPIALESNGITATLDSSTGKLTLNGTSTARAFISFRIPTIPIGEIISLSANNSVADTNVRMRLYKQEDVMQDITFSEINKKYENFTNDKPYTQFQVVVANNSTLSNFVLYPQLELNSSATTFELSKPFTTHPINLPVQNLFDKDNANLLKAYINTTADTIQTYGVTGADFKTLYISCLPNTTYTISKISSKRFSVAETQTVPEGGVTVSNKIFDNTGTSITITTSADAKYLIVFYYLSTADTLTEQQIRDSIQIELGDKVNRYTSYGVAPIELCEIGDYQDYIYRENGNWYKYEAIKKTVLDGSEKWNTETTKELTQVFSHFQNGLLSGSYVFSDRFQYGVSGDTEKIATASGAINMLYIAVLKSRATNSTNFKTWLSTHNTTVYYVLATPTSTQITDTTLISQLEAWYKTQSKNGQTNVLQTNTDNPFVIFASALKGE